MGLQANAGRSKICDQIYIFKPAAHFRARRAPPQSRTDLNYDHGSCFMDVEGWRPGPPRASPTDTTGRDKQKVAQEALDNPVGKGASHLCEATNHDEDKDAALGARADLCGAVAVVPPNASAALACNDTTVIIGNTPGHAVRPVVTQASNPSERTTPPSFGWEVSSLSAPTLRFGYDWGRAGTYCQAAAALAELGGAWHAGHDGRHRSLLLLPPS